MPGRRWGHQTSSCNKLQYGNREIGSVNSRSWIGSILLLRLRAPFQNSDYKLQVEQRRASLQGREESSRSEILSPSKEREREREGGERMKKREREKKQLSWLLRVCSSCYISRGKPGCTFRPCQDMGMQKEMQYTLSYAYASLSEHQFFLT